MVGSRLGALGTRERGVRRVRMTIDGIVYLGMYFSRGVFIRVLTRVFLGRVRLSSEGKAPVDQTEVVHQRDEGGYEKLQIRESKASSLRTVKNM